MSSSSKPTSSSDSFSLLKMIASAFNTTIQNVSEAPIQLMGFRAKFLYDSKNGITNKLFSHYKENIISTVLKIIGSLNIIGNPIGLFREVGSGIVDFFEMPIQGLSDRGPLGLGLGIMHGTHSLLKKTFAGTCNSIHTLTDSLGTGLTLLTFDEKYLEKRSRFLLKKPKNVIDGIYQGGKSIYHGFKEGVTGVVLQPIKGAENDGVSGLLKGGIQGLAGLVIKPVGGVLDATSKTAEGLKNTATYYDDKPNSERMRLPRVFYENERQAKFLYRNILFISFFFNYFYFFWLI